MKLYKYKYTTQGDLYSINESLVVENYVIALSLQEALDSAFKKLSSKDRRLLNYSLLSIEYVPNEVHCVE